MTIHVLKADNVNMNIDNLEEFSRKIYIYIKYINKTTVKKYPCNH